MTKEANLGFILKKEKVFHSCLLTVEKAVWGVGAPDSRATDMEAKSSLPKVPKE